MLIDICDEIIEEEEGEVKDFAHIIKLTYLNEFEQFEKEEKAKLKKLNIKEENGLLFYGKDYPIFRSLCYFNEVPIFRKEKDAIVFLNRIGIDPNRTLKSLSFEEKKKLGNEFLNKALMHVPKEYSKYLPSVVFGKEYYFKGIELREYVSSLNGLYKIGKKRKVKNLIVNMETPHKSDIKKYKKEVAKRIMIFKKKLNDEYRISYFSLNFKGRKFLCQYIYIKQSVWDFIKGFFGEGIELKYYPTLINIAYSSDKVDFLKPLFIFVDKKDVSVYAKVPKLIYLKDGLTLNHLNLKGKHIYFGIWDEDFWKILERDTYEKNCTDVDNLSNYG
ncbi:DHH family phosphoesterase [Methanotorris formicicus]|uniref:Uncharacterized protein n=1 Tax=Methanotorris formicicus Mc-S-70 TaxID=647171 RepID=H1KXT8_9EURY|nr:DHH family phosphoesterase [Methanotorris formicicus]EHP87930.1 hypothetical protein MetfoDRAFT_0611 [Methanotorris formicicus Mc-S-70]